MTLEYELYVAGLEAQVQQAQTFLDAEAGLQAHVQNVEMRANAIKAECEERVRSVSGRTWCSLSMTPCQQCQHPRMRA